MVVVGGVCCCCLHVFVLLCVECVAPCATGLRLVLREKGKSQQNSITSFASSGRLGVAQQLESRSLTNGLLDGYQQHITTHQPGNIT